MKYILTIGLILMIGFNINLIGQKSLPRLSPKSFVGQTIGYTNVKINYSAPGVKGRNIWGDLVPYHKVWRTGANEATTIEFDNDILIEGKKVPAGKYSLFTIPKKKTLIVILNKNYDQWGAFKYNKDEDLIRIEVNKQTNQFVERLKFSIDFVDPYLSVVNFEWEKIKFSFKINSRVERNN